MFELVMQVWLFELVMQVWLFELVMQVWLLRFENYFLQLGGWFELDLKCFVIVGIVTCLKCFAVWLCKFWLFVVGLQVWRFESWFTGLETGLGF